MTVRWPKTLAPRVILPSPVVPVTIGGQPLAGSPGRVASSAGAVRFEYQDIPLYGARLELARAIAAQLGMGVNAVLVSPQEFWRVPAGMTASTVQAVAAAQTSSLVVRSEGALWSAGKWFGVGGERSHLIGAVAAYGGDPRDQTLTFWPPLRAAQGIGDAVEYADPLVKCFVADPARLLPAVNNIGQTGSLSLAFQEDF